VSKSETLDRYAATWSRLFLFLIRPRQSEEAQAERIFHPFQLHDELASSIQRIIGAVEELHAVEWEHADCDTQSCDSEENPQAI
jgi:hypothetical protein